MKGQPLNTENALSGQHPCQSGGMVASGMSKAIAVLYVEMGQAISNGILFEDFNLNRPDNWGCAKLADFAKELAAV